MKGPRFNGSTKGLSPRERGNHMQPLIEEILLRSIPARAGEPRGNLSALRWRTVYPRASGGTSGLRSARVTAEGLSPRERGNQARGGDPFPEHGSIPARAGEPRRPCRRLRPAPVYPRASGGTRASSSSGAPLSGLSPRERGNLSAEVDTSMPARSIPARAGEPLAALLRCNLIKVYPRASGGTDAQLNTPASVHGLSPRERGNRLVELQAQRLHRSIPARAGEPSSPTSPWARPRVYPRASGGTASSSGDHAPHSGLSPRERGNRLLVRRPRPAFGSIPARAGEPALASRPGDSPWVYPRASGGTASSFGSASAGVGLSPRERGNRLHTLPYQTK